MRQQMQDIFGLHNPNNPIDHQGIKNYRSVYYNLNETELVEAAVKRSEGTEGLGGSLLVTTGIFNDGTQWFKSAGYNCSVPGLYTAGCAGVPGIEQNVKGNNLPGSSDRSYGMSLTQDIIGEKGVTSVRFSYRYRGEADLSIFNMERLKLDAQKTSDLLVRYTPNSDAVSYTHLTLPTKA